MKAITGVSRVTFKKSKTVMFAISKPDVVKSPHSDTYVIFGEAKMEDLSNQLQPQATEQLKAPTGGRGVPSKGELVRGGDPGQQGGRQDGRGQEDIELLMTQASALGLLAEI
ncbi:hypothetical protein ACQ4PT_025706 [Festuca glaucescens]